MLCRLPPFFDDIAARLLPVIPLIIYRLIENDALDAADRVLQLYSTFLHYYPLNFTFVRDILAYFYGHLPGKLILRILNVLDIKKVTMLLLKHPPPPTPIPPTQSPCGLIYIGFSFISDSIFRVIPSTYQFIKCCHLSTIRLFCNTFVGPC